MEEKLVIHGGRPLRGEVTVSGGKNTAVAILPAVLLADDVCTIENLPLIEDIWVLTRMLKSLGARVDMDEAAHTMRIDPRTVTEWQAPVELVRKMRASYYLMGALIGRFGKAEVAIPGGCDIGARPIDQHIKGFSALGVQVELSRGNYVCDASRLHGAEVYLDMASVGATINIMLAAAKAPGKTTIVNAAKEPHVVDLANFLNSMGARVKGAGTDTIRISGVERLHGCAYPILPDQIETGTWMIIAAATRGDILIHNCVPVHMESVSAKLSEMGIEVVEGDDSLRVIADHCQPKAVNIKTLPYPGFPTDLQQPFTVLLSTAQGTSMVTETIFEARYRHVDQLRRMGAQIRVEDRVAVVDGVGPLWGVPVAASDLRAGAALIVAGLVAEGETTISNVKYIDRGYERIEQKLVALGADITRVQEEDKEA